MGSRPPVFRTIAILCVVIAVSGFAFGFWQARRVAQFLGWVGALDRPPYVLVDGIRVRYQDYGRGSSAVVFVHGWSCDSTFWRLQVPDRGNVRYILIDLPGHGKSDVSPVDYSGYLFVRSVQAVMRNAGVEKVVLVGHSMGAAVALQFVHMYPKEVAGLVLVDGSLPVGADPAGNAGPYANIIPLLQGKDYLDRADVLVDSMSTPQTPPALAAEIRYKMLRTPQHVMITMRHRLK